VSRHHVTGLRKSTAALEIDGAAGQSVTAAEENLDVQRSIAVISSSRVRPRRRCEAQR
jgi:hypothetical protein